MSMRKLKSLKVRPSVLVPVTAGLLVAGFAIAWSGPPGSPPTCPSGSTGCSAPVDTSSTAQTKSGSLSVVGSSAGGK